MSANPTRHHRLSVELPHNRNYHQQQQQLRPALIDDPACFGAPCDNCSFSLYEPYVVFDPALPHLRFCGMACAWSHQLSPRTSDIHNDDNEDSDDDGPIQHHPRNSSSSDPASPGADHTKEITPAEGAEENSECTESADGRRRRLPSPWGSLSVTIPPAPRCSPPCLCGRNGLLESCYGCANNTLESQRDGEWADHSSTADTTFHAMFEWTGLGDPL